MTTPAFAEELGGRLPSATERAAANQLRRILVSHATGEATLQIIDDETKEPSEIRLTPGLSKLLTELLRHIGNGDAVTLVPVSQMLSTQQAADILNVSRPFLISLIDKGEIDHELVGRHRRIKAETLFAYKRERNARRSKALDGLAVLDGHSIERYSDISCSIDIFRMIWHVSIMSRPSRAASGLPPQSQRAIAQLGKDISIARRRRKLPQRLMAERMLVSVQTLQRLEAGDSTVGLAVLASALHVFGMTQRLAELVAPDTDRAGISEDLARLPKTTHAVSSDELDF